MGGKSNSIWIDVIVIQLQAKFDVNRIINSVADNSMPWSFVA